MGERKDKWLAEKKARQVRELDFRRIEFSDEEIDHARRVTAANACLDCHGRSAVEDTAVLLWHLGLAPEQDGWYYSEPDPYTPKPKKD